MIDRVEKHMIFLLKYLTSYPRTNQLASTFVELPVFLSLTYHGIANIDTKHPRDTRRQTGERLKTTCMIPLNSK